MRFWLSTYFSYRRTFICFILLCSKNVTWNYFGFSTKNTHNFTTVVQEKLKENPVRLISYCLQQIEVETFCIKIEKRLSNILYVTDGQSN